MTAKPQIGADDDVLIAQAAKGDRGALEVLLERHTVTAVSCACSVTGNREDALDVAQAALIEAANLVATAQPVAVRSFRAALYMCVHRAAVNLHRKDKSRQRREHAAAHISATATEVPVPSDKIERDEAIQILREEMATLPEESAAILGLYHCSGLPVAEIATHTGLSANACMLRLSRSREHLHERLVRRGVSLATLVIVTDLLEHVFASGTASAAEVDAQTVQRLSQTALSQVSANPQAATAPQANRNNNARGTARRADRSTPEASRLRQSSARAMLVAALLFMLVGGGVFVLSRTPAATPLQKSANSSRSVAETSQPSPQPSQPEHSVSAAKGNPLPASPAQTAPRAVAARWQEPRFIEGEFTPLAISSEHDHVVLLASGNNDNGLCLRLYDSKDGGQTWTAVTDMGGYSGGSGALDGAGGFAILGMVPQPSNIGPDGRIKNNLVACARIEFRRWTPAGGLSAPQTLWQNGKSIFGLNGKFAPRVVGTKDGAWLFALNAAEFHGPVTCEVAFALSGHPAQIVAAKLVGRGDWSPSAWALDEKTAGVFLGSMDGKSLIHYTTTDAGATWQSKETLCPIEKESDSNVDLKPTPVGAARDGRRLAVIVNTWHPDGDAKPNEFLSGVEVEQTHMLLSSDLGATLSVTNPPTARESWAGCWHGAASSFMQEGTTILCHDSYFMQNQPVPSIEFELPAGTLDTKDVKVTTPLTGVSMPAQKSCAATVRSSSDNGQTWKDESGLPALSSDARSVVIGGDGSAIYIAASKTTSDAKSGKRETSGVVIYSYNKSEWKSVGGSSVLKTEPPKSMKDQF